MCEGINQGLSYEVGGDAYEIQKQRYSYNPDTMSRFQLGNYLELDLVEGGVAKGELTGMINDNKPLIEIDDKKLYFLNQIKGNPFIYTSLENFFVIEKDRYQELISVRQDNLIKDKYTIYENDEIKGTRITIIDCPTGAIIRETK